MEHLVQERKESTEVGSCNLLRRKMRRAGWFVFCALFFALPHYLHAAGLFLTPASQTVTVGQEIDVLLRVNTQGAAINAIESTITYPASLFEGVSTSKTGSILTIWAQEPTFNAADGTVRFAGGRQSPGFTGTGDVLRIRFRARQAGNVAINIGVSSVLANDGNGTELFASAQSQGARYVLQNAPTEPVPEPVPVLMPVPEPVPVPVPEPVPETQPQPEPVVQPGITSNQPEIPAPTPTETPTPQSPVSGSTTILGPATVSGSTLQKIFSSGSSEIAASTDAALGIPATLGDTPVTFEVPIALAPAVEVLFAAIPQEFRNQVRETKELVRDSKAYQAFDKGVINNPIVEEVSIRVAAPAIVATAVANVGLAARLATLFTYLQGIATQPFLLFSRKRRKQWGVLYSSLTKLPVDLALVRLFDSVSNKLLQTRVSDKQGRYLFLADPGSYRIGVMKPGFAFPSEFLKGKTADLELENLYHGEVISISQRGTAIARPIPLDPIEKAETPKDVISRRRKERVHKTLAWISPTLAVAAFVITPTPFGAGLIGLQLILLALFKRLGAPKKSDPWGKVLDEHTKKPIPFTVVRIFDVAFNKLLETQITDRDGRYTFLAGRGKFYITAQKQGYESYKSGEVDLTQKTTEGIVRKNIILRPGNGAIPNAAPTPERPLPPLAPSPAAPAGAVGVPTVKNPTEADRPEDEHKAQSSKKEPPAV